MLGLYLVLVIHVRFTISIEEDKHNRWQVVMTMSTCKTWDELIIHAKAAWERVIKQMNI